MVRWPAMERSLTVTDIEVHRIDDIGLQSWGEGPLRHMSVATPHPPHTSHAKAVPGPNSGLVALQTPSLLWRIR